MKKFTRGEVEIWVGLIQKRGPVVFDPRCQEGIAKDRVRLFVCDEKQMKLYDKDVVRSILKVSVEADAEAGPALAEAAVHYLSLRRDNIACYACGQDINSIDFSLCARCGWIKCICGACKCDFRSGL